MDKRQTPAANVAANVRRLRAEKGLSLEQLAMRVTEAGHPMSLKTLSKLERGDRKVDVDDLAHLAAALDETIELLMVPPGRLVSVDLVRLARRYRQAVDERTQTLRQLDAEVAVANKAILERVGGDERAADFVRRMTDTVEFASVDDAAFAELLERELKES